MRVVEAVAVAVGVPVEILDEVPVEVEVGELVEVDVELFVGVAVLV